MTSFQFSCPVRLQVDLSPPPETGRDHSTVNWPYRRGAKKIIEAIVDGGLLFLDLAHPRPGPDGEEIFLFFLEKAAAKGISVSVVLDDLFFPPDKLTALGAAEIIYDLTASLENGAHPCREMDRLLGREGESAEKIKSGFLYRARSGSGRRLLDFLEACGKRNVSRVGLPPPPLVYYAPAEGRQHAFSPGDYRRVSEGIGQLAGALRKIRDFRVHDVLLWAIIDNAGGFKPETAGRFRGCQAAAALGYVSADGLVYPCSVIRAPLGEVEDMASPDFWQSFRAVDVRRRIAEWRESCRECLAEDICQGGCPGHDLFDRPSPPVEGPICRIFKDLVGPGDEG